MKVVVDTDVIAAALLGQGNRGHHAEQLLRTASDLLAPTLWKAEFANVLWKYVVFDDLEIEHVNEVLRLAEQLPIVSIETASLWRGATARAVAHRHPVYDTLFVELAIRNDCHLASYDKKLRRKFEETVSEPESILKFWLSP